MPNYTPVLALYTQLPEPTPLDSARIAAARLKDITL